jgi:hypothetical protein
MCPLARSRHSGLDEAYVVDTGWHDAVHKSRLRRADTRCLRLIRRVIDDVWLAHGSTAMLTVLSPITKGIQTDATTLDT